MRSDPCRKELPFWKRDIFTAAAVVTYLALACGAVEAWNFLSQKADTFAAADQNVRYR